MDWMRLRARARQFGSRVSEIALRALLPETCAGCGKSGCWICGECVQLLQPVEPPGCHRCGQPGVHRGQCWRCAQLFPQKLLRVRAGFVYEGPIRRAIQRFKYNGEYQRGFDLGRRLGDRFRALFPRQEIDLIAPVPLHPRRYRSRGFNQSGIVAECLANVLRVPVVNPVKRVRDTVPQVQLSANDRIVNLQHAFQIEDDAAEYISSKSILLIDDVMTTGATLAAVAGEMQFGGCRSVYGLTLAREQ